MCHPGPSLQRKGGEWKRYWRNPNAFYTFTKYTIQKLIN